MGTGTWLGSGMHLFARSGKPRRGLRFIGNWLTGGLHFITLAISAQADSPEVWPYSLCTMSLVSFVAWIGNYRRLRYISDTPTSRVASAAQGYVELTGRGEQLPNAPLLAKISLVPCTWYRYSIEKKSSRDKWSHVDSGESNDPFAIRDQTGICVIEPEGAEIITAHSRTWRDGEYRYTEWLLLPQDRVYAIGEFATVGGSNTRLDLGADVGAMLADWKRNRTELHRRFDLDKNGTLDLREWQLARRQARREVETRHNEVRASAGTHVMRCPPDNRLYLISNYTPEKLHRRYQVWTWVHIIVFLGAGGWAYALLHAG